MSSHPNLILDTNVLRNKEFIIWVKSNYHGKIETSPVAYMELRRQLLNSPSKLEKFEEILSSANITVASFTKKEAIFAAELMHRNMKVCEKCKKIDWADTMIYASIGNPPTLLVTDNVDDFPDKRVMTPNDVMDKYKVNAWG